jgi:hypothetical protein
VQVCPGNRSGQVQGRQIVNAADPRFTRLPLRNHGGDRSQGFHLPNVAPVAPAPAKPHPCRPTNRTTQPQQVHRSCMTGASRTSAAASRGSSSETRSMIPTSEGPGCGALGVGRSSGRPARAWIH